MTDQSKVKEGTSKTYVANLSTEVIGKTTVGVEDGEVGTANVADTELLVAGRSRGICQLLQLTLRFACGAE